ncbi:hypothetical protein RO3G_01369 [Lichtheimia corymbifera JMRC:FSU:9682]|uniref:F-box domain-containing protein n=1 Tax=Lichtheimia corymbifera JMRC:FSU:9682 TaxID=1263082 RepID=A0A068RZA2_9FUNG|nr:hypothetical protein RO3G_01369 [Lichtheimia corymbifera JMRC:FSU:9682]
MVMILELPNEILCLILTFVPPSSGKRFLSCCHKLYQLKHDQLFWRDFARHLGIIYRDPQQTWWDLYATGDVFNICKHLHNARLMASLIWKSDIFWKSLTTKCCQQQQQASGLCLYPYCDFVGCGDAFFSPEQYPGHLRDHYNTTGHPYVLKLSADHFLEVWCYACNKPVGFWGFPNVQKPITERYLVRMMIEALLTYPQDDQLAHKAKHARRAIERRLVVSQESHDYCYIIERKWFLKWNDFLSGLSDELPGPLQNEILQDHQGNLKRDILLGTHFELVSGPLRSYIERAYGLHGNFVSGYELQHKHGYRQIWEAILFRRHILHRVPGQVTGPPSPPGDD